MPIEAIDSQPFIEEARCYYSCVPSGLVWYTILAALVDISEGTPVPTDPNELIDQARCLESCIPPGYVPYAILGALAIISGSGGGGISPGPPPLGAAPEIYQDVFEDPNGNITPNNPNQPAIYMQLVSSGGSGVLWHWEKDTHVWN